MPNHTLSLPQGTSTPTESKSRIKQDEASWFNRTSRCGHQMAHAHGSCAEDRWDHSHLYGLDKIKFKCATRMPSNSISVFHLNKDFTHLTTFISPFRRFCFNRLPFGITLALEYFSEANE